MNALWAHTVIAIVATIGLVVLTITGAVNASVSVPLIAGVAGSLGGHSVAKAGYANAK